MILANLRLMLSLRFLGKNAGVAQKTSENKPDPRTGHAREGVRHPKHRLARGRPQPMSPMSGNLTSARARLRPNSAACSSSCPFWPRSPSIASSKLRDSPDRR